MDDMTISDLATCARDAQDGAALMRGADKQMKQAHEQWIEGALKAAGALYAARKRLVDHAVFGKWCDDNGLNSTVISKDERAALIKIGADVGGWRETLAKTESRSLRLITAKRADPFSQLRQAPSTAASPQGAPKVAPADAVRSAPAPKPTPSPPPTGAPFEIETFVLGYEARSARFPTAPEIAEALQIDETSAATGLAAVVKARKAGVVQPIQFSPAQTKHVEAFEEALKRRYYRLTEAEQRKLQQTQREAFIDIEARAEARAGMYRQFATDKLHEWTEAHAVFGRAEYGLLQMGIQKNASDETRHKAAQLLNERAFLATGGKMGTPDDITRAKRTRAEAEAERTAKRKATMEANKAAKAAAAKAASDDTMH